MNAETRRLRRDVRAQILAANPHMKGWQLVYEVDRIVAKAVKNLHPEPPSTPRTTGRISYAHRRVWATTQLRKRHAREWQILRYDIRAEIKAKYPDMVGRELADRIETRARQVLHDRYPQEWVDLLDEADRVMYE